jgi:2-methylcitrate dehydratase PrpD
MNMAQEHSTLTAALATLAVQHREGTIPDSALAAGRKVLLDAFGCALAGRREPGTAEAVKLMMDWSGKGEARVLFFNHKLPAPHAAFANSAMIHALDYDDLHLAAALHVTSVVVPAALAAAEMTGASGRQMLDALVLGVEAACRLGLTYQRRRQGARGRGFLPTSVVCGFGAVAAAARLRGFSTEACTHAMGINCAQASGSRQALHEKTLTKRLQPAFAVRSALWAVELAARGVSGPEAALEGEAGLFALYQGASAPTLEELVEPRDKYEIERLTIKKYTSCGACHSSQEAAERLAREASLRPEDIREVALCGVKRGGLVGKPFELGANPQVNAQFSVQYAVAYALLRGRARLENFTDKAVRGDREVAELAKSIRFVDEYLEPPPPAPSLPDTPVHARGYHAVIVTTRDGRRFQRGNYPYEFFKPASTGMDDVEAKFMDCAAFSRSCSLARAREIIQAVHDLQQAEDLSCLFSVTALDDSLRKEEP